MSINWKMDKQSTVNTYPGTALGNKRKPTVDLQVNMEGLFVGRERCQAEKMHTLQFHLRKVLENTNWPVVTGNTSVVACRDSRQEGTLGNRRKDKLQTTEGDEYYLLLLFNYGDNLKDRNVKVYQMVCVGTHSLLHGKYTSTKL